MSVLPRVTELTRERISREFDDLGPDACMAEIQADLRQHNPELLDMASRLNLEPPVITLPPRDGQDRSKAHRQAERAPQSPRNGTQQLALFDTSL